MAWTAPRTWIVGEIPTAAEFNTHLRDNELALAPAGTTYTNYAPALTAVTVNPTLGTGGSTLGRYLQIGKMVHCYGRVLFGSSGVLAGTGVYQVSLPVNWSASIGDDVAGGAYMYEPSSGNFLTPLVKFDSSNTGYVIFEYPGTWPTGVRTQVTQGTPWAWAANDQIRWNITYEAA